MWNLNNLRITGSPDHEAVTAAKSTIYSKISSMQKSTCTYFQRQFYITFTESIAGSDRRHPWNPINMTHDPFRRRVQRRNAASWHGKYRKLPIFSTTENCELTANANKEISHIRMSSRSFRFEENSLYSSFPSPGGNESKCPLYRVITPSYVDIGGIAQLPGPATTTSTTVRRRATERRG